MGDNLFKKTYGGGDEEAEDQQNAKPRQSLFHRLNDRLGEVFLCGQACKSCIVLTEFFVQNLHKVLGGDYADELIVVIQHRDGGLGIVDQGGHTVIDQRLGVDIGIRDSGNVGKGSAFPGDDQILQIDRAAEGAFLVNHIESGHIVVLRGLTDQLAHSALNGGVFRDLDIVGTHFAADLVLVEGGQQTDLTAKLRGQQVGQLVALQFAQSLQKLHSGGGFHQCQRFHLLAHGKKLEKLCDVLAVFQYADQGLHGQKTEKAAALLTAQFFQGKGDVLFVVICDLLSHLFRGQVTADKSNDLIAEADGGGGIGANIGFFIFAHRRASFPIKLHYLIYYNK